MPRPAATDDTFRAIADRTRRDILELLGSPGQELPVTEMAVRLGVSVPLLSRHLAVLRTAGMVAERRDGRRRLYRLNPEPLKELYDWAVLFQGFWTERITQLRNYLGQQAPRL